MLIVFIFLGVEFPMALRDVQRMEKNNKIRINIFRLNEGNKIFPYYISEYGDDNFDKIVDVLELCSHKGNHFVWIKSLSRALFRQISPNANSKVHICRRCLFNCYSAHKYDEHIRLCKEHKIQAISLPRLNCPKKLDKFSYSKDCAITERECELPFYMYADIECLLKPSNEDDDVEMTSSKPGEKVINRHEPSSMAYICVRLYILH